MNSYEQVANSLFKAECPIAIDTDESADTFMQHVLYAFPKLLSILSSYEAGYSGGRLVIVAQYRDAYGAVPAREDIEERLRQYVSSYSRNVTFILPEKTNIQWIMKCFMNEAASFYPNLRGYQSVLRRYGSTSFIAYELRFRYRIGTVMLRQMEEATNVRVKELSYLLFPMQMPDSAKCLIAHNYLADSVTYMKKKDADPLERSRLQSAYGALINRECVCHGYAEAYKRILNAVGVPCDLVVGKILNDTESMHAWNIVQLRDGAVNCHIDVTGDSKPGVVDSTHFLKGDRFYVGKREWNRHFHAACEDGSEYANEAKAYCVVHRKELLASGLNLRWIT